MTIPTHTEFLHTAPIHYDMPHDMDSQGQDWIPRLPPDVEPVDVDALIEAEQAAHREQDRFMRCLIALALLSAVVISLTGCGGGGDICDEQPAPVECQQIPAKNR